jgi:hypothetical protein
MNLWLCPFKTLRIRYTYCFGYPVADLEEAFATSFFDIKFLDDNCKTSDLEPKMAEILHFYIPPVKLFQKPFVDPPLNA